MGLRPSPAAFLFFVLACWTNMVIAFTLGFAVAAAFPGDLAPAVVLPCFATLHAMVAGFLVSKATLPPVWRWLYWISYEQWTFSALMINQFGGAEYDAYCSQGGANSTLSALLLSLPAPQRQPAASLAAALGGPAAASACLPLRGDDLLAAFGLDDGRTAWFSLGCAAATAPALMLLFYVGVRTVRHERR